MTYTQFLTRWNDPANKELAALHSVKAVRALTGLSQVAFATTYGIPEKTLKGWETTTDRYHRECPPYVLSQLAFIILSK